MRLSWRCGAVYRASSCWETSRATKTGSRSAITVSLRKPIWSLHTLYFWKMREAAFSSFRDYSFQLWRVLKVFLAVSIPNGPLVLCVAAASLDDGLVQNRPETQFCNHDRSQKELLPRLMNNFSIRNETIPLNPLQMNCLFLNSWNFWDCSN